jgi:hypothetical protein
MVSDKWILTTVDLTVVIAPIMTKAGTLEPMVKSALSSSTGIMTSRYLHLKDHTGKLSILAF